MLSLFFLFVSILFPVIADIILLNSSSSYGLDDKSAPYFPPAHVGVEISQVPDAKTVIYFR